MAEISVRLQAKEGTDAALALEFDFEPATGHDATNPSPAGFVVQIDAVHVEALTEPFDPAFFARHTLDISPERQFHTLLLPQNLKRLTCFEWL